MKDVVKIKLDPEALAVKVSILLDKTIDAGYIRGILTPKGKRCSDKIKMAIIKVVESEIDYTFDFQDQVEKILRAL